LPPTILLMFRFINEGILARKLLLLLITLAMHLRAAVWYPFSASLLHKNITLCTVTFGQKILTLAKSRGS
jgi:hypothetical protein